jgi:hypothetical protein
MKTSNKPFMESYKDKFKIGDIVYWNEWDHIENLGYSSTLHYGAIIQIKIKKNLYNERSVWVAEVLPFGKTTIRELSLHLLTIKD